MAKRDPLLSEMDRFGRDLMKECGHGTVVDGDTQQVDFRDRIALMSALTRYLAVKHKIEPEGEGDDFLGTARRKLAAPEAPAAGNRQRRPGGGAARPVDSIALNPPAPAGRAVGLGIAVPDTGPGDHIGQTGSDFWRAAGDGAGARRAADAAAGPDRRNGSGGHGDE